jgi:hypothetical protein
VCQERVVDFRVLLVGERPAEIDAGDLGAARAGQRLHADRFVIHPRAAEFCVS